MYEKKETKLNFSLFFFNRFQPIWFLQRLYNETKASRPMLKVSFLYLIFIAFLLIGSVSFLEDANAGKDPALSNELLLHQWVITGVEDLETGENISAQYASTTWQFLEEGIFLQFENNVIRQTGTWKLNGSRLKLKQAEVEESREFSVERLRRNELVLQGEKQKIRLLKLVN